MRLIASLSRILLALAAAIGMLVALIAQPFVRTRESTPPEVDAARLDAHVRMLSETLYPRSVDQEDQLEAAASYIHEQLEGAGGRVEEQSFAVNDVQYRNIVARYGPDQGPVLVVGAHYDSVFYTGSVASFRESHTPGADDNASGVAGLLELGRLLGQQAPPIAVELVAYCLEEPPYFRTDSMGSARHARSLRESGRDVKLMLSLEMIGYFDDRPGSQSYPMVGLDWIYPKQGDFIAVVGRVRDWSATRRVKGVMRGASDLPVHSINAPPALPGVDFSDHASYWNEGFTALMITDTAFLRNPNYHEEGDTAERLDYRRMAKVVQGVYAIAEE